MTYQEIVAKVQAHYKDANADQIQGHLAVQFNITGEGHGAFYLEVQDGKVDIQPYEYYGRDVALNLTAGTLFQILNKETTIEKELNDFHMSLEGSIGAALILKEIQCADAKPIAEDEKRAAEEVSKLKEEIEIAIAAEVLKAEVEAYKTVSEAR